MVEAAVITVEAATAVNSVKRSCVAISFHAGECLKDGILREICRIKYKIRKGEC